MWIMAVMIRKKNILVCRKILSRISWCLLHFRSFKFFLTLYIIRFDSVSSCCSSPSLPSLLPNSSLPYSLLLCLCSFVCLFLLWIISSLLHNEYWMDIKQRESEGKINSFRKEHSKVKKVVTWEEKVLMYLYIIWFILHSHSDYDLYYFTSTQELEPFL